MTPVKPFALAFTFLVHISSPVAAQFGRFEGTPQIDFTAPPCDHSFAGPGYPLTADFHYLDQAEVTTPGSGRRWVARIPLCTDGATIPDFALVRAGVGSPFDPDILPAAVVHDHHLQRKEVSARQTHRLFYDGLRAQGVSWHRASIMYAAVFLWNPYWTVVKFEDRAAAGMADAFQSAFPGAIRLSMSELYALRLPELGRTLEGGSVISFGDAARQFQSSGIATEPILIEVPGLTEDRVEDALERFAALLAERKTEITPEEIEDFAWKARSAERPGLVGADLIYLNLGGN